MLITFFQRIWFLAIGSYNLQNIENQYFANEKTAKYSKNHDVNKKILKIRRLRFVY